MKTNAPDINNVINWHTAYHCCPTTLLCNKCQQKRRS